MPHSKKQLRKISKSLGRSGGGSKISNDCLGSSSPRYTSSSVTVTVHSFTEDHAHQLNAPGGRKSGTPRSLSVALADLEIETASISSKRAERISDDAITVIQAPPDSPLLGVPLPDPFLDSSRHSAAETDSTISNFDGISDHSKASVEDNVDEIGTSSSSPSETSSKDERSQRQPQKPTYGHSYSADASAQPPSAFVERRLSLKHPVMLPLSYPQPPRNLQQASLKRRAVSDGIHRKKSTNLQVKRIDVPSSPSEPRRAPSRTDTLESRDRTEEHHSQSTLGNNDSANINGGSRTIHWIEQTPHDGSMDPPTLLPAWSPVGKPPLSLPVTIHQDYTASDVESQATTLPRTDRPPCVSSAAMNRPLVKVPTFGSSSQSLINHPQGPPWGYHSQTQVPGFNSPVRARHASTQNLFATGWTKRTTPGVYHDIYGPRRQRQHPIAVPMDTPQHRGLPPYDPAHMYEPVSYENRLETYRRLRNPDWTHDARGRAWIPKHSNIDERNREMNVYTQRYYGKHVDAARDLHFAARPKEEPNLGGLLS